MLSHSVNLVVCKETLAYTRGITVKLQGRSVELMEAYHSVELVIESIKKIRLKVEEYNKSWFKDIQKIADKLAIEIKKPRSCCHQMNRSNVSADCPSILEGPLQFLSLITWCRN